jgi:hypothetical protein
MSREVHVGFCERREVRSLPATLLVVLVHGTRAQAEAIKQTAATLLGDQLRLTLSPEKTRITHVDDGFDFLGFRIVRLPRPGRTPAAFSFPTRAAVNRLQASHQDADRTLDDGPAARRALACVQPRLAGLDRVLPSRREQALLCLPRPLPVDEAGAVAAQEAPADDLKTDQAAVHRTRVGEHRGHQALLARHRGSNALQAAPPPPAMGHADQPGHRPRHERRQRMTRPTHVL